MHVPPALTFAPPVYRFRAEFRPVPALSER